MSDKSSARFVGPPRSLVDEAKEPDFGASDADYNSFIVACNGLYNVAGGTEGAEKAAKWLEEGNPLRKVQSCMIVAFKPSSLLFEGSTKKMRMAQVTRKSLPKGISAFLPKFSDEDLNSMDRTKKLAMETKRAQWPAEFKRVNITQCRRIAFALIFWGNLASDIPILRQWRGKYQSLGEASRSMTGETKTIFEDQVQRFQSAIKLVETTALPRVIIGLHKPP